MTIMEFVPHVVQDVLSVQVLLLALNVLPQPAAITMELVLVPVDISSLSVLSDIARDVPITHLLALASLKLLLALLTSMLSMVFVHAQLEDISTILENVNLV